jgi:hypothetical protein
MSNCYLVNKKRVIGSKKAEVVVRAAVKKPLASLSFRRTSNFAHPHRQLLRLLELWGLVLLL